MRQKVLRRGWHGWLAQPFSRHCWASQQWHPTQQWHTDALRGRSHVKSNGTDGRNRLARAIQLLILLAVAAVLLETWCLRGLFCGLEVSGGSMAPTLVGAHHEVICGDCSYGFDCGVEGRPARGRAVCPNCDFAQNRLDGLPLLAGDRVLVSPAIYRLRPPRRWELAAFRHPEEPGRVCVKRVVGLPGESVQIRDGEVYVDGRLARKPLERQRALAVLVFDANFPPSRQPGLPPRWQSERARAWGSAGGRFAHAWIDGAGSQGLARTGIDWLIYCHRQWEPGDAGKVHEGPITNRCGYNQHRSTHPANVHPVRDVLLSFRLVRASGSGRLLVRASDGREEFVVAIDPAGRSCELSRAGVVVASGAEFGFERPGLKVEVALVDGQLSVAGGGRPLLCYQFDPPDGPSEPTSRPLAIGAESLGVEIQDVRVYRDVYYNCPLGAEGRWGVDLPSIMGNNEYFVLGDNSLISSDSRVWRGGPGVPAALFVGKPVLVAYPARRIKLGRLQFQVPDPAEIRYIR